MIWSHHALSFVMVFFFLSPQVVLLLSVPSTEFLLSVHEWRIFASCPIIHSPSMRDYGFDRVCWSNGANKLTAL